MQSEESNLQCKLVFDRLIASPSIREEQMVKRSTKSAGNKQGRGNSAGKARNPASNTATTGNTQLAQSRPDATMAAALAGAGLPQR
jgi:hypothetical protein